MHNGRIENSDRLRRTLAFVRSWGATGAPSAEIQGFTGSMAVATDISEIRRNGYDIECKYVGMTDKGRKVYNYTYRGKKETA